MKNTHILTVMLALLLCPVLSAQEQPLTPEQREKKMRENIDAAVLRYEKDLRLEDWQSFYVDSILTHNIGERNKEMEVLSSNKVENMDLYTMIADKWEEATYNAFRAILSDEQWNRYLKSGAGRNKKARDKRAEKRSVEK